MIWPEVALDPCVTVTPYSLECLASPVLLGGSALSAGASAQWLAQHLTLYFPFTLTKPTTAVKMFSLTGATSAGEVALGIYDKDFTALVRTTTSTQGATNTVQSFDITDTTFGPGLFYLAMAVSSTAATFIRGTVSAAVVAELNALGCAQDTSTTNGGGSLILRTVGQPVALSTANNFVPVFGFTTRTVI